MRWRLLPISLLFASPAAAIGLCEGLETTYRISSVSEKTGEFTVLGETAWCVDQDEVYPNLSEGDEGRFTFGQLIGFDGEVRRVFVKADERQRFKRLKKGFSSKKLETLEALEIYAATQGFVKVERLRPSPSGACEMQEVLGKTSQVDTFPERSIGIRITVEKGKRVERTLGYAAAEEARQLSALFLPQKRAILLWAALPQCEAGFSAGPDDPPDCQLSYTVQSQVLTLTDHPSLSACFAATALPKGPATGHAP